MLDHCTRFPGGERATRTVDARRSPPAVAIAAAALLAGMIAADTSAQVTSANGQIAYVACDSFTSMCDIWVMNADGSGNTNLTNTPDRNEVSPAWSADGTRLAFFEDAGGAQTLTVMNADGSNRQLVTTTNAWPYGSRPTWSPGGTQIAFVRNNPGSPVSIQADIVVIDLTTLAETVVSRPVDFGTGALLDADEIEPAWSPDGGKIAFAAVRLETYPDPITGAPTSGAQWEIVTVNPDGSGEQIVSAGDRGSLRAQYLEEDRAPSWSPDGSKLVFMSQAQIPACCGPWQIWAVNRDGTGASNLTSDETVNDLYPTWSPDGSQIVFTRFDGFGGFDLYTMPAPTTLPVVAPVAATRAMTNATPDAATGPVTRLTNNGNASDADWQRKPGTGSQPGTFVLYVSITTQGKGAGGSVTSNPAGIKCERDCTEPYAAGTQVALTAAPKKGTAFAGWSGACAGIAPVCQVTMNDVRTVGATFTKAR